MYSHSEEKNGKIRANLPNFFKKKKNNGINTATYSLICTYFSYYLTHYEIKSLLFSTPKNVSNST